MDVVTTNMIFKPSLDYSKPRYKDDEPLAFFIIDKRTGDRRLSMCLPKSINTAIYELVALFADKTFEIKEHAYKYKKKPIKPAALPPPLHINRITDCY